MNDDAKKRIVSYQQVFKHLSWKAFPFDNRTVYTDDDNLIRDVLKRLHQLDPSTPLTAVMEIADTDWHYVMVSYEEDLELVMYWFTHFGQEGDKGYMLYRISHFIDPSFNFIDYGHQFNLPDASMVKVYMDVYSRLITGPGCSNCLIALKYSYRMSTCETRKRTIKLRSWLQIKFIGLTNPHLGIGSGLVGGCFSGKQI
jgi:hypothetical protein